MFLQDTRGLEYTSNDHLTTSICIMVGWWTNAVLAGQADAVIHLQNNPNTSEEDHFTILLVQMETERIKFVLRSYLRTRLNKVLRDHTISKCIRTDVISVLQIEQYTPYILATPEVQVNLSELEQNHVQQYGTIELRAFY